MSVLGDSDPESSSHHFRSQGTMTERNRVSKSINLRGSQNYSGPQKRMTVRMKTRE